jgi:psp operon transcriptional activator
LEPKDSASDAVSSDVWDLLTRPLKEAVWGLKVRMLENALEKAKFNQKKAARLLGLTYHQFRGLYRQYQRKDEGRFSNDD